MNKDFYCSCREEFISDDYACLGCDAYDDDFEYDPLGDEDDATEEG